MTGSAPTRATDRIDTLDVLRGVAICGILLMNIPLMGLIGDNDHPREALGWTADWIAWSAVSLLFEGTMRGLFTMLFGAGMVLMLRRAEGADASVTPIDIWTRRCLALMLLGVVQFALFLWPGEILWTYGLTGLALLAFRTARPRALLIAAGIVLACWAAWSVHEARGTLRSAAEGRAAHAAEVRGEALTGAQRAALLVRAGRQEALLPTATQRAAEYARRTQFPGVLGWSTEKWTQWNLGAESWPWVAESLAFMLIGMALFRTGILTGAASPGLYRRLIIVGYGGGLALRAMVYLLGLRHGFSIDIDRPDAAEAIAHAALYQPGRLLVTLGHCGLIVALYRAGILGRAWPLRALGRMALTVYSLQSILTSILFYGAGLLGLLGMAALVGIAASIWLATGLFSIWWLRRHDMGPAERLLRAAAYGTSGRRDREQTKIVLAATPPV